MLKLLSICMVPENIKSIINTKRLEKFRISINNSKKSGIFFENCTASRK